MGIDHGLGGRENEKCKEKRKKKAARRKTEILRTICDNSNELKKEVVFNESARADWLTGFNKRKQMRRQYGVAMQCLKEKKKLKDAQAQKRDRQKKFAAEHEAAAGTFETDSENEGQEEEEEQTGPTMVFEDAHTQGMFGSTVAVTVDSTGIADELEQYRSNRSGGDTTSVVTGEGVKSHKQQAFDKAIKAAKSLIETRKVQKKKQARADRNPGKHPQHVSHSKAVQNKHAAGKKLLTKAMGHKARKR